MALRLLNLQLVLQGRFSKLTFLCHANPNCRLKSSSVAVSTNKSPNLSEPEDTPSLRRPRIQNLFLSFQPNTIGVIGGFSVLATLVFLEKLVYRSSRNGQAPIPFIACNDHPCLHPLSGASNSVVVESLRRKREFLEQVGVGCLVMPCHDSHAWQKDVSDGTQAVFLHAGECVAKELKEARLGPAEVASRTVRIGLIGPEKLLDAGFYQEHLQHQGFEVCLLDKATRKHIVDPAIESLRRKDVEGARNLLRIGIQMLLVRASTVVLAFNEFQGLLPYDDPLRARCIDPMDALVRSAIRWAKSTETLKY